MDLNLIKRLVRIVESSQVTDLEIEENGLKVKIAKKVRNSPAVTHQHVMPHSVPVPIASSVEVTTEKVQSPEAGIKYHEIKSPIVGTFYRAPAPDADSYVQIGDDVSVGAVLCIVEAMKLMNEIESDVSGKVVKILVENGKPVEYNQTLFLI
ncbi:MAG TPA: acetyl-CoA carboxylase biotin carboxyl carrier protein, partial [Ignavibacteriaceae bacterium]